MCVRPPVCRAVVLSLCVAGLVLPSGCGKSQVPAAAPAGASTAPAPEVSVVAIAPQPLTLTAEMSGRISAELVAEVRPQVGGIVQQRLFVEGSDVKAGDVLYQIDPAMYQASYDSAKAALAKAEASLTPAKLKAERFRELVKTKAVSQQDYDEAEAAFKLGEADLALARAAFDVANINLAYTQVKAPISGRIGKSAVTTGALVTASQPTSLAVIQNLDAVYVDVTIPMARLLEHQRYVDIGFLRRNGDGKQMAAVKLLFEDGSPYAEPGVLKFSDITVDTGTGSVSLRTKFPNPDHRLLPGMYVRAIVEEGVVDQAILVPQQAVTRDARGNPTALVVDASGKVETRNLKIARDVNGSWLVADGLKAGEQVIMEGSQRIRPGTATVRPVPFAPHAAAPAAH